MTSEIAKQMDKLKRDRHAQLEAAGVHEAPETHFKTLRYNLAPRRPGIRQVLGQNPLADDDDFEMLNKYMRLKKERV